MIALICFLGAGFITSVLVAAHCAVHGTDRATISRRIVGRFTTTTRELNGRGLNECGLRSRTAGNLVRLNPEVLR